MTGMVICAPSENTGVGGSQVERNCHEETTIRHLVMWPNFIATVLGERAVTLEDLFNQGH